jgi:hypothetical protein
MQIPPPPCRPFLADHLDHHLAEFGSHLQRNIVRSQHQRGLVAGHPTGFV